MTTSAILLEKTKIQKIGKMPVVVVLPLADWQNVEIILEEHQMEHSSNYLRSIKESRKQIKAGKLYELDLIAGNFKK